MNQPNQHNEAPENADGLIIEASTPSADHSGNRNGHHHRHHRHHHRRKRTIKGKIIHLFTKHRTLSACIIGIVFLLLLVTAFFLEQNGLGQNITNPEEVDSSADITVDHYLIGVPVLSNEVYVVSEAACAYMNADISTTPIRDIYNSHHVSGQRLDISQSVLLSFDVSELPDTIAVRSAKLELADNEQFQASSFYELAAHGDIYSVELSNLKTGTAYTYRAIFTLSDHREVTAGGTLYTAKSPRLLTIDGIHNVRDIGGWSTIDDRTIRQGLLFRGSELDGAVKEEHKLTAAGVNELVLALGIKSDMDLRSPTDTVSGQYILGSNVRHTYYDIAPYAAVLDSGETEKLRQIFQDLANPDNYPIYLHCTDGYDRTGTICYLLEALLGVSESDLIREFELSGLYLPGADRANIQKLYMQLQNQSGFSLRDKVESYLLSIGVTEAEIESIRTILLQ